MGNGKAAIDVHASQHSAQRELGASSAGDAALAVAGRLNSQLRPQDGCVSMATRLSVFLLSVLRPSFQSCWQAVGETNVCAGVPQDVENT